MTVAADVLAEIDPVARPPRSVRDSGAVPWRLRVGDPAEFAATAAAAAAALVAAQSGDGTMAVIGPQGRLDDLAAAVAAVLPDVGVGDSGSGEPDLERPVVVLTVRQAKGLEFDSVLVADPGMILAESPRGLGDLYVALTRATQRVGVVYSGDLPAVLGRLTEVRSVAEIPAAATVGEVASDALDRPGPAKAEVA